MKLIRRNKITYKAAHDISHDEKLRYLNEIKVEKNYFENKNVYIIFAAGMIFTWLTLVKPEGIDMSNFLDFKNTGFLWWTISTAMMFVLFVVNIYSLIPNINRKSLSNTYYRSVAKKGINSSSAGVIDYHIVAAARSVLFKERMFRLQLLLLTISIYLVIGGSNPWERTVIENVFGIGIILPVVFFCFVGRGPITYLKLKLTGKSYSFEIEDGEVKNIIDIES